MQGLSEAYVISFCAVPYEYAAKDAVVVFAVDHNEFFTKIFGTDVFEERKIDFEKIETSAPIVQEEPVDDGEKEPIQEEPVSEEPEIQEEPVAPESAPPASSDNPEQNTGEVETPDNM